MLRPHGRARPPDAPHWDKRASCALPQRRARNRFSGGGGRTTYDVRRARTARTARLLRARPMAKPPAGGPRFRAAVGARGADAQAGTIPALPQRARCPLSQYAPPRWLHANGETFALPLDRAQQFCSARPRARTKGRAMLRTWQSASKNFSVQGKALQKAQPPQKKLFPCALASARFFWYYMLNTRAGPLARFVGECPSRARFLFVWHKS